MIARLSSFLVAGSVILAAAPGTVEAPALKGVALESVPGSGTCVKLAIPGFAGTPQVQVLPNPNRVVVDLPGVLRGAEVSRKDLGALQHPLILKSRVAQFAMAPAPVTRLVLEVQKGTQVEVTPSPEGVRISLAPGQGAVRARLGVLPQAPQLVEQVPVTVEQPLPALAQLPATVPSAVPAAELPSAAPLAVSAAQLPAAAPSAVPAAELPAKAAPAPLPALPALGGAFQALPAISRGAVLAAPVHQAPDPKTTAVRAADAKVAARTLGEQPSRYTGSPISIDVRSIELSTFLRLLAEHTKLNFVADPDVQGRTFDLMFKDTPWDLVLEIVLKHAGLGKETSHGVVRVAKMETLQAEEKAQRELDEAKALAGDLTTIYRPLSYAKAADAKAIIDRVLTKRGTLIIDERTNTLILTDLPKNITLLDDLVSTLDVPIQQVMIEARVVEANKGYEKAFGVRWPTTGGDTKLAQVPVWNPVTSAYEMKDPGWGGTNMPSYNSINNRPYSGTNSVGLAFAPGKTGVTDIAGAAGEFWVSFLSNRVSINVLLQALEKEGTIKIVSTPKVVTQNNKKAHILSGEKIPYPSQQGGAAGGAISVAFVEANLALDVIPQITSDGTILMTLKVEKAEADFSRTVQGSPTIMRKEIETQVLVKDGGTAVLGGVYTTSQQSGQTGVPFLQHLPLVGWLFRSKTRNENTAELLVFITPRILRQ